MGEHIVNSPLTEARLSGREVNDQARIVADLLREYANKLVDLRKEFEQLLWSMADHDLRDDSLAAWLLDQSDHLRKPLVAILSRASSFEEHGGLDPLIEDEIRLRRTETEIHLHHVLRLTGDLRSRLDQRKQSEDVARLRMAAGLSGMKGGPLRPN
jgi:hypothetical protein